MLFIRTHPAKAFICLVRKKLRAFSFGGLSPVLPLNGLQSLTVDFFYDQRFGHHSQNDTIPVLFFLFGYTRLLNCQVREASQREKKERAVSRAIRTKAIDKAPL
jgi:hypothetical protein